MGSQRPLLDGRRLRDITAKLPELRRHSLRGGGIQLRQDLHLRRLVLGGVVAGPDLGVIHRKFHGLSRSLDSQIFFILLLAAL